MKILENIPYSKTAGPDGVGDLYLPENLSGKTPLALSIHGGAWSSLDKGRMTGISTFLCRDLGMAVFNINYRLTGQAKWPAGGDDCLAAAQALLEGRIREVKNLDREKILIIGASSGGHYALMTGLRLPPQKVSGIISIAGINSVKEDMALSPGRYRDLFGHEPGEEELALIDPVNFLKPDSPPILCTHDLNDNVVPCRCTRSFAAAAEALGVPCSCYHYQKEESGRSHRIFIKESVQLYEDIEKEIIRFVCKYVIKYIPEPQVQKSAVEISAFYYPGTEQMAEWDQVEQTRPGIKPLLGWYDEGNPEVVDWQIKWAVEHGISSFCVDWYWNKGVQRLDHWVKAFYKARFRKYLKWYIMWANHNEVGAHSAEDQKSVTRFWIDNYFSTPEYYTIDGHPVVVIWSFRNLDRDLRMEAQAQGGELPEGEGIRRALEISNGEMRKKGLPEIYFINMCAGMEYTPDQLRAARAAGSRGHMIYNIDVKGFDLAPEKAHPGDTKLHFNYDCVLAGAEKWWQLTSAKENEFPLIPTLSTGWNSQPRTFEQARVIYDRTPEKYLLHCRSCRRFCQENDCRKIIISPLNEWQEGSYIEPNEEYGFAMYEVLRETFCTEPPGGFPANLLPADTGRGPYDYPAMERPAKTSWDFSSDLQHWYRNPFGTAHIRILDGALHFFRSGGDYAALRTRLAPFPAENFSSFRVMMKVTQNPYLPASQGDGEFVRLYFGTTEAPLITEQLHLRRENAVQIPALPDGRWHEYTLDLSSNPLWKGMVNELWFDPPQISSALFDIRWMKLEL